MRIIHYATDSHTTGDDIASAVIEYAKALAKGQDSMRVAIPFRRDDGSTGQLDLLIGPASQIVLESVEDDGAEEMRDEELVARIQEATRQLLSDEHPAIDADDQVDVRLVIPEDL